MGIALSIGLIIVGLLSPGAAIVVGILLFIGAFILALWQDSSTYDEVGKDLQPLEKVVCK